MIDPAGPHIQRAAEDIGEAENIIDLIGIVRPARGDDGVGTHGMDLFRRNFRIRIGHGEDQGIGGHRLDHLLGQGTLG